MADARRIIFGNNAIAKETTTSEEGGVKTTLLTQDSSGDAVLKKLGSTGNVAISDAQWGEGWSSMGGIEQYWEDFGSYWEQGSESYSGIVNVSNSVITLADSGSTTAVKFVYIKNTGDNQIKLSLDGTNYDILISSGGSVSFRGVGLTSLLLNNLKVLRVSSDSSMEFIIAI